MAYLNCGRCGLEIKIQAAYLRLENCPRCLARAAIVSPMVVSRGALAPAAGWGTPMAHHTDRRPVDPAPQEVQRDSV
jgi:hypothetical protein